VTRIALTIGFFVLGAGACARAHDVEPARQELDPQAARAPLRDACQGIAPKACGEKAALLSNDPATEPQAVPMLRAACSRHDPVSCHNLGTILALSSNVSLLDGRGAVSAYEDGCGLGDLMSCCDAGDALERGTAIGKDLPRAAAFYKRGCDPDEGMFICCIGLERIYKSGGPGVTRDRKLAASYYRRAKILGYSEHLEDD
jgi:TPR repeat protein